MTSRLASAALLALVLNIACSKDSSSDAASTGGVTLSGKIGTGFSLHGKALGASSLTTATEVNQIWAIPIKGVSLETGALDGKIELDIADDGSFSFNPYPHHFDADTDFIFALVNKEACDAEYKPGTSSETVHDSRRDCITGYVSLPAFDDNVKSLNDEGNLSAIPFSEMIADVDLGELEKVEDPNSDTNGDAQSETSLEEQELNFKVDLEALRSIAKTDGMLRHLKNIFANTSSAMDSDVTQFIAYKWFLTDSQKTAGLASIKNQFGTPSANGTAFPKFIGFHTYLKTDVNASSYTQDGQGSGELVKIVPPGEVSTCSLTEGTCGAATFSPASPYVAGWPVTKNGDDYTAAVLNSLPSFRYSLDQENKVFGAIGEMIGGLSPDGFWTFYMNPSQQGSIASSHFLGKFDMSLAEPFSVDATGKRDVEKPVIFYPAVKATVENDLVTRVDVKFYTFADGAFTEASNEIVYGLISKPYVYYEGVQGCTLNDEEKGFELTAEKPYGQVSSTKTFGFPGTSAGECQIGNIAVAFAISGLDFVFHW